MTMNVLRFALTYSPPTLMVEYKDLTDDAKYVKKINIKNIASVKTSEVLVNELRQKYPNLLGPNVVEEAQIKGLVERLINSVKKNSTSQPAQSKHQTVASATSNASTGGAGGGGGGTVMFKRAAVPTTESDIANLDLNVVSDEVNQTAKRIMDSRFEANRLKPGDEGYVWDKAVEFEKPSEVAEWDEESDEYDF